jgi:hypothetical protein
MPNWNLRASAQVSDPLLMPEQISDLDAALRHLGCHEAFAPSFLQLSSSSGLQSQDEWLLLVMFGMIIVALLLGGAAFWSTVYESGKFGQLDEDHLAGGHHRFHEDHHFHQDHHHHSKASKRQNYVDVKKFSTATHLFPYMVVGNDFSVRGTLSNQPEDLLIEVTDEDGKVILRALVCETGEQPGILLEDAFNTPMAFIDTYALVSETEKHPALEIHKLGEDNGIFGTIKKEESHHMCQLVVRYANQKIAMALQVDSSGRSLNAVDDRCRLVGTAQRQMGAWKVRTAVGADAGVMICGLLGSAKVGYLARSHDEDE